MGATTIPIANKIGINNTIQNDIQSTPNNDIDSGPTILHGIDYTNDDASTAYLKAWDDRSPNAGTDAEAIQISAGAGANVKVVCPGGIYFENGLSYSADSTQGTAAASDPSASDINLITTGGRAYTSSVGQSLSRTDLQTSVTTTTIQTAHGTSLVRIDNANENVQTAASSGGTLYFVQIDNTASPNAANYLKLFYTDASVTPGTTQPNTILYAPKGRVSTYAFLGGLAFATGLKFCVITQGGTAGTAGPTTACSVTLYV